MSRLRTVKNMAKTLNVETDLYTMLQQVLERLLAETEFSSGWLFLITPNGKHQLYAESGLPQALAREECSPLKNGGCWCKTDFLHGQLNSAVNMIRCQRLERSEERQWGDTGGITHHATIPIHAGEEPLGILNIAHPRKTYFADEELELLELIALQIGTAIKRVALVQKEAERAELYSQLGLFLQALHTSTHQSTEHLLQLITTYFPFASELTLSNVRTNRSAIAGATSIQLLPKQEVNDLQTEILTHIAEHMALSLERQRIAEATKELAEVNERQRLSRELHDSVNQLLFSVNMTVNGLALRTTEIETKERLQEAGTLVKAALGELKAIIRGYRGEDLDRGLDHAICQYSKLINITAKLDMDCTLELPPQIEEALYRMTQEALNNCKKHSGTNEASIKLSLINHVVCFSICDKGTGFIEDEANRAFGLTSIYKRAAELGGTALLFTSPGTGTKWQIRIPFDWSDQT